MKGGRKRREGREEGGREKRKGRKETCITLFNYMGLFPTL